MAKAKQLNKPIEELMEEALIIYEKTPYKVPDNWCWTKCGQIASWGSGGTPSRKNLSYYKGNIPWVKTGELDNDVIFDTQEKITEEAINNSSAKIFPKNSVLIAMYGATIGKTAILGISAATNQACASAICSSNLYHKYLFYYLISQKHNFVNKGQGGAQPNISQEIIKQHEFPFAPLAEQKRIVERIESFFAKLDEARDLIQKSLDAFADRKSAILHKAFSGELTANWREENNIIFKWEKLTFDKLVKLINDKFNPKDSIEIKKYIGLEHLKGGGGIINFGSSYDIKSQKNIFKKGDLLYGKLRPYLNKHSVVSDEGVCSTDILVYRETENVNIKFVDYLFNTNEFINFAVNNSKGINLPRVSAKDIAKYNCNIPSFLEQTELVRILDNFFEKEDNSQELMDMLDRIDEMKKVILARAFRGELGTNNPADEPAKELLKKILEGRLNEN